MALPEKARDRLQDVREFEPTSNGELRDRWGMDSGKDVARYLRDELGEYTQRDDDSRICAVDDAPVDTESNSDDETDEAGTDTVVAGGEDSSDLSPSESDGGAETRRSTDSQTTSGRTLDLSPYDDGEDDGEATTDDDAAGGEVVELPDVDELDGGGGTAAGHDTGGSGERCPECGSGRFGYVRDERETLRARRIDPEPLPPDARICYDCWRAAASPTDASIYTVGGETDAAGSGDEGCPECGSGKAERMGTARWKVRRAGGDPSGVPDDALVCGGCWPDSVTVYRLETGSVERGQT